MKKRIIIEIICGVLIFVIGLLIGDANAINRVNKNIDKKISSNDNQSNSTSKETSNEENKNEQYKLNEIGKTGNYQLKTTGYSEVNEIQGVDQKFTTKNKYVVIDIEIASNDVALDYGYSAIDFKLVDSDSKVYNNDSNISISLNIINNGKDNNYLEVFESLNPNVFKKTQLVFEVPKDIKPTLLINKNGDSKIFTAFELK